MGLVELYSGLLVFGLGGSQLLPVLMSDCSYGTYGVVEYILRFLSLVCLSFIMMHAGMHFHVDRRNLGQYAVDYLVAMSSAAVPWIFAAVYFALLVEPHEEGPRGFERWKQALLVGRFAAPTSAGVLFSMLDACQLSKSWLYTKAKILAIFDDLDTILLMIPLKVLLVGFEWEVGVVLVILTVILWLGWTKMHAVRLRQEWYWVMLYATAVAVACDGVALVVSWALGPHYGVGEIHIEVLLPAFVLGMMAAEADHEVSNPAREQRAQIAISAVFMLLVGLSMPPLFADKPDEWNVLHGGEIHKHLLAAVAGGDETHSLVADNSHSDHDGDAHDDHGAREDAQISLSAGMMVLHVVAMSVLMVVGKLSCFFNYSKEASWRERLALGLGMCPRGEVGAGVIVVAASVGVEGNIIGIAVLALSLNLVCTGAFIALIRRLLDRDMQDKLQRLGREESITADREPRPSGRMSTSFDNPAYVPNAHARETSPAWEPKPSSAGSADSGTGLLVDDTARMPPLGSWNDKNIEYLRGVEPPESERAEQGSLPISPKGMWLEGGEAAILPRRDEWRSAVVKEARQGARGDVIIQLDVDEWSREEGSRSSKDIKADADGLGHKVWTPR